MRVLNYVLVALAVLAPALGKGDKLPGKTKSLSASQDNPASDASFSLARSPTEPVDEEESFDMSVANADTSSGSSDGESSQLSSPSLLVPPGTSVPVVQVAHGPANESTPARPGRSSPHVAFSQDLSPLSSLSALSSGSRQRSASLSPPPTKRIVNPLDLDNPVYRAPSPDTPERVGRRHLALNAPPVDKTFYNRPKFAKDRRSNLDVDRRLDRTFHPYFIFDSEARRKRHNDLLQEIKRLLLDLELSTNAHFVLFEGRPEKNPAQREELARVIASRTIDANPNYRALVERFLGDFGRHISTPRRAEHAALLELAQRELEAHEREEQARAETQARMAESVRVMEETQRKMEQRTKVTTAKPKTRSAARGDAPGRSAVDAAGSAPRAPAAAAARARPAAAARQHAVPAAPPARAPPAAAPPAPAPALAAPASRAPAAPVAPRARAPAAAAPARAAAPPARAPAAAAPPARAPAPAAPLAQDAVGPAADQAPVVVPHAAYVTAPRTPAAARQRIASPPQADQSFESILEVHSEGEATWTRVPKKNKGKGKAKAAPAPPSDKAATQSRTSSVVPDSEPERQYEAARLLSLRMHAEHQRALAQPGASTSRTTLDLPSTPRRAPTEPPSTPATARPLGALSIPEHAEPKAAGDDVEDQLPADVRHLLQGALPRPYWLAVEHIWRTYPPRDYLDGLSDLNARFELDMDISFIIKLMTLLSRTSPPAPL